MTVTRNDARAIATLAHLELDDEALDRMAAEMTQILAYVDQLREVPIEAEGGESGGPMTLRADEPHASLDRVVVARNAPAWRDGFFVVPKVLGGD